MTTMFRARVPIWLVLSIVLLAHVPSVFAGDDGIPAASSAESNRFFRLQRDRGSVIPGKPFMIDVVATVDARPKVGMVVLASSSPSGKGDGLNDVRYRSLRYSIERKSGSTAMEPREVLVLESIDRDELKSFWNINDWCWYFEEHLDALCILDAGARRPEVAFGKVAWDPKKPMCEVLAAAISTPTHPTKALDGFLVRVVDWRGAIFVVVLVLLLTTVFLGLLLWRFSAPSTSAVRRFVRALLTIIEGDDGRYSISRLQMLVWTYMVGFALVYVGLADQRFVELPGSVVMLLGISTTAFVARKKKKSVVRQQPKLSDLITVDDTGSPVLGRIQLLVFTAIVATITAQEVVTMFRFPEIKNELLCLMGVSNGYYLLEHGVLDRLLGRSPPDAKPGDGQPGQVAG